MKYSKNIWKLTLSTITNDVSFSIGVSVIFMMWLGLSIGQISWVITAWLVASTIGNIPAGIFADRYGYKMAITCGSIFFLGGTILFAWARDFYWLFGGYALMGFGSAMKQGADQALLFEGLKSDALGELYKKVYGRMEFLNNIFAGVILASLGGFLYVYNPRWPFYAEVILASMSFLVVLFLKEPRKHINNNSVWRQIRNSFNIAFKTANFSRIFIFSALIGSIALTTIQYVQPLYKLLGINSVYFGMIAAFLFIFRGLGAWYSDKLGKIFTVDKYLVLHASVFGLFLILVQKTNNPWLVISILAVFFFLRGLYAPTVSTWINNKVKSNTRATMLSVNSQILTLVTSVTLLATGLIADKYGLYNVFFLISIISLVLLISYVISVRKLEAR